MLTFDQLGCGTWPACEYISIIVAYILMYNHGQSGQTAPTGLLAVRSISSKASTIIPTIKRPFTRTLAVLLPLPALLRSISVGASWVVQTVLLRNRAIKVVVQGRLIIIRLGRDSMPTVAGFMLVRLSLSCGDEYIADSSYSAMGQFRRCGLFLCSGLCAL